MDFGFNKDQALLASNVRQALASRYPIAYVRRMLDDPRGFSKDQWRDAAELGWLGLLIDEDHGGAGLGMLDLVAVQHELGRGVLPGPFLSSAVLATTAIMQNGSAAQKAAWLPRLAAGEAIGTVALLEPSASWDASGIALPAKAATNGTFTLTGEKRFVGDAHVADFIVVPARTGDRGASGITLFLIETSLPGVTVKPMQTIDATRRQCEVHLDGVVLQQDAVLGTVGTGWARLQAIADVGRVALCAEIVGGAERALEMAADYARTREQFGKPIGSFQAIQHKCADMLVLLEGARSMTIAAALALAHGDADAATDASIAKAFCGETYRAITTEGIQIHGGLGFTWELDMHLYYKRAKASETLLGDARFHRMRLGERARETA